MKINKRALDEKLTKMCKQANIPGMALLATKDGEILYEKYVDYRNVSMGEPITGDTIFGVASLTKSITALAVMLLQDERKLSVDEEVTKWLPTLTAIQPKTTIHHLLTHTAGYPGLRSEERRVGNAARSRRATR